MTVALKECGCVFGEACRTECYREWRRDRKRVRLRPKWPMKSMAAGVHRKQVRQAMARDRKLGVPIDYDSVGRAVFRDAGQRYNWMKAHGMHDNNGGYRG